MDTTVQTNLAERVIGTLRAHEPELRAIGVVRLTLFGSVARGDSSDESDVDLLVEFEPQARGGTWGHGSLTRRLEHLLGRPVDLVPEPVETPRLKASIERDQLVAF